MSQATTLSHLVSTCAAALLLGCGARTGLNSDVSIGDAAVESCAVGPLCSDNTRGTWQLENAGYLFTFDGSVACNGTSNSFLLVLGSNAGQCSRNGDYTIQENTASSFRISAANLGGSFSEACGGDPGSESLLLQLSRSSCEQARYDLVVDDSKPASPYDLTASATRCRCDVGWVPCLAPLPADPCAL